MRKFLLPVSLLVVWALTVPAYADSLDWRLGQQYDTGVLTWSKYPSQNHYIACRKSGALPQNEMVLAYSDPRGGTYVYALNINDQLAIGERAMTLKSLDNCIAHFE